MISLWDYKMNLSELKSLRVRVSLKAGGKIFRSKILKIFAQSDTFRSDKTTFQYSFLYFSSLLIVFLNHLVLFPIFPPTHQLRIMTVRENGIYERLLFILIDDRIV